MPGLLQAAANTTAAGKIDTIPTTAIDKFYRSARRVPPGAQGVIARHTTYMRQPPRMGWARTLATADLPALRRKDDADLRRLTAPRAGVPRGISFLQRVGHQNTDTSEVHLNNFTDPIVLLGIDATLQNSLVCRQSIQHQDTIIIRKRQEGILIDGRERGSSHNKDPKEKTGKTA